MRRTRDPDRTQRSILDAAASEFCAHGPAGARIDAIAGVAGVNKRMLYHYYGSKEGLFGAVLEDLLGAPLQGSGASLSATLIARHLHAAEHPDEIRLLMWEALADEGRDVAAQAERAAAWRDRVGETGAQRDVPLVIETDAAHLELTFVAIAIFPFAFPQLTRLITGRAISDHAFVEARGEFLSKLAALFETRAATARPDGLKPRFRLAATVTESAPRGP